MSWPALVCPDDGELLVEVATGIRCARGHQWPRTSGIVRMVPEAGTYADAFGLQWNIYRRTQLDSYTGTTISRDRVQRCLGETCWQFLHRRERTDVLEVGCGAGRFTEVLVAAGAYVTSVDLSSAVDANQQNCPQDGRHRILQADVARLPFAPRQFDMVFCLGVVQHTPDPEQTIRSLYEQVGPGGWLVLDHYTRGLSNYTRIKPLFRMVLRRLPPATGLRCTEGLVKMLLPLHKLCGRRRIAHALLSRFSPVSSYYHALALPDDLQREWALLDTHDSLTDGYKHFRTRSQIRRALESLGAADIWCEHGGNGVEARCRRPAAANAGNA